jgi:hypothetical protein
MRLLFAAAAAACLLASGCSTTKLDADIRQNLPAICTAADQAHGLYLVAVAAGKVSAKNQARADAAWASLQPVCADPASQTTASIVAAAFAAYLTISSAAH